VDAEERLQIAQRNPVDWSPGEVVQLLAGFGFECWEGKKHTVCRHPGHPEVYHVIPRHRVVRPYVVRGAVRVIETLKAIEGSV
jgi:hypothetical protein